MIFKRLNFIKDTIILIICILFAEQLLFNSSVVIASVKNSLHLCVEVVIPSLFCFMVLTYFISETNLGKLFAVIMLPITRFLSVPVEQGSTVLMSLIGGYPVGIKTLANSYQNKQLSEQELKRMVLFCCCPAPSFVIVTVGTRFLGNLYAGLILYSAQVIALLFMGLSTSIIASAASRQKFFKYLQDKNKKSYGTALVEAVVFSSQTLLSMCGYIVLFGVFGTLLKLTSIPGNISVIFSALLEITTGCSEVSNINIPYKLCVLSFLLSFGGISIIFQLKSILGSAPCSLLRIFIGRLCHAVCSAVFTYILINCFPEVVTAFSSRSQAVAIVNSSTPLLSFCLIGMITILLFNLNSNKFNLK